MPRILITGASGFIGSFLVERGLELGYEVWAAVRFRSSRRYLTNRYIRFLELDLEDEDTLRRQLMSHNSLHGPFDAVIHAAGVTKCRTKDEFFRVNAEATGRLARLMLDTDTLRGRFVFVSSLSVMGAVRDDRPGTDMLDTDTPAPNTAYGRSKLQAERLLETVHGLDYVVLRPTGVYGPRECDYYMMAKSIKQHIDFAVGTKPQHLTFIYVRDLANATFLALERGVAGRAYFLTDGHSYSPRAFAGLLQEELGVRKVVHVTAPLWVLRAVCAVSQCVATLRRRVTTLNMDKFHILRQRNWRADITPARRDLGYEPQWSLERGVAETITWYCENGWLRRNRRKNRMPKG